MYNFTLILVTALANITNYDISQVINPHKLTSLTARVYNATASSYNVLWRFADTETLALNKNFTLPSGSPLIGVLNNLTVTTNPKFFKESFKYVFYLDIVNPSPTTFASISIKFVLTMNNFPQSIHLNNKLDGYLYLLPNVGVYNSTNFLLSCKNWTDDNTGSANLMYKFTYLDAVNATIGRNFINIFREHNSGFFLLV